MSVQAQPCDHDRIEAFLDRRLSDSEQALLEEHLSECSSCRASLGAQTAEDELWDKASRYLQDDEGGADPLSDTSVSAGNQQQSPSIRQVLDLLQPTDDPQMLGRLDGYEVSGVVGAGGMGVVLKAYDKSLDRTVAIKVLAPHLASSGAARKRFAREAKAAAAVLHSNVVAIHGVSNGEPLPYLVMPYVRGQSLQKRIEQEGPLPLGETLRIGSQIAAGLAAAHAQGLVHRDITPANVLLEDGVERVAITDFGLARAVDDATMTRSGVITGTPQYMSPEQAKGEAIDHRSDLFSLGSVLYFMCTGHSPFRAETTVGVLRRISDETPRPICEISPEIPDWLEGIIGKLLAKEPDQRFQSAAKVADLLGQWIAHLQQPSTAPRPRAVAPQPGTAKLIDRRVFTAKRWLIGLATAAMLVAATVFFVRLGETTIRFQIDDPNIAVHFGDKKISFDNDGEKIHITPGEENTFIISKEDGSEVVGSSLQLKKGQKVVLRVSTAPNGEIQILPDPSDLPPPATYIMNRPRQEPTDTESAASDDEDPPKVSEVLNQIRLATAWRNQQLRRFSVRIVSSHEKTHAQLTESLNPLDKPESSSWEGKLLVDGTRMRSERLYPEQNGRRTGVIAIRDVNLHAVWNSDDEALTIADDTKSVAFRRRALKQYYNPDPRELGIPAFSFEPNIRLRWATLDSTRCLRLEETRKAQRRYVHFIDPSRDYILLRQEIHYSEDPPVAQFHDFEWARNDGLDCYVLARHTWTASGPEKNSNEIIVGLKDEIQFLDYDKAKISDEAFSLDELRRRPGRLHDYRITDEIRARRAREQLLRASPVGQSRAGPPTSGAPRIRVDRASAESSLPELTVRMLYIKRDWPSGESDKLKDEMLAAAAKRELAPALKLALSDEDNIGPHDFFPCIEQAAIFDPADFESLLGWLREHDLLAKETVHPKQLAHVARWRRTIDHTTAAGFGSGVSSLGVSIAKPQNPEGIARIKIHLTRAAALDAGIPPRMSGEIKTYDPVSLSLPKNRVAAFRWYPGFSDVKEDPSGTQRLVEPIFVFQERRAANEQDATSGVCQFPERVVRLAVEPDPPPQTPPAPISNNIEEPDDDQSLKDVVRQIAPGKNTPFRGSLSSHAIDDRLAREEYELRLEDRKQRPIYLDAVRRVWYATEKRRRLLNSCSVTATSSTTDDETQKAGSWGGKLLIKGERARSERTWTGAEAETDTAIRTNESDFALNSLSKKLETTPRKGFSQSATLFHIRREDVKRAPFVPDPRDLALPNFYNEPKITAELAELGLIPCLRLEEVRSTPGQRHRLVHFVDPNREAILLRRELHVMNSNRWRVYEFDWEFHEELGCHVVTKYSEKRYRQDQPTAKPVAYWRQTIEYRDYKPEDLPDTPFDINDLREGTVRVQDELERSQSETAADAETAVIRITTSLGVEKTMEVKSCLAIGEPKWDPCVIARSRSTPAARDFLILKTDEPVYFRIPIRLISQVNARDSKHVVEFVSGEKVTGKLACFINGYDLTTVEKLVVISAPRSSQLTSPAHRSDHRWRLSIDGPNKFEFNVRNARWAYTPTKKNEEEYDIAETPTFHVVVNGRQVQAYIDDFQSLSSAEVAGSGAGVSLTATDSKRTVGSLRVGGHRDGERIGLFVETSDGMLVTLSHYSPDWTLTAQE
jgi:serine/threonine protein kinase